MFVRVVLYYTITWCVIGMPNLANGKIIINPKDQEAAIYDDVSFTCASDINISDPVVWKHRPVFLDPSKLPLDLFQNGYYYDRCQGGRCDVNNDGNEVKLIMRNVSLDDAGTFICTDRTSEETAELIVFDLYPSSDSCYIKQSSQPSAKEVKWHATCSMSYSGNLIPRMEWRHIEGDVLIASTDKTDGGIITSTIQLSIEQLTTYLYVCRVGYETASLKSKYEWSTMMANKDQRNIIIQEVDGHLSKPADGSIWAISVIVPVVTVFCVLLGIFLCLLYRHSYLKRILKRLQPPDSDPKNRQNDSLLPNKNAGAFESVSLKFKCGIDLDVQYKVSGMVAYDNKIYMVYLLSNKLSVFKDEPPFKKAGEDLTLDGIKESRLIDACIVSQCIYIADAFCECIWKIGQQVLEQKQNTINTWKTKFLYPYKFSVISLGRVLIPSFPLSMLTIYKSDGTTERQIYLGMSLSSNKTISCFASCHLPPTDQTRLEPIYALEISTGNILVCCGDKESKMHVVLAINIKINPEIMWQYGDNKGYEDGQFNCPRHLVEDEDGMIYVADQYNRRVIILNTSGQRVGSNKITDVTRVCYLRNCKKLLAGFASINCYNVEKNIQEGAIKQV